MRNIAYWGVGAGLGAAISAVGLVEPVLAAEAVGEAVRIGFTGRIGLVFAVLALVICLFVFEWVRVDVVGIMMMVILPILGLVTPEEAISGLSSNAVVAIIAVIIIGAGLDKTGCMNVLAARIVKLAHKSERRIMTLISATAAVISSFMQKYRRRRPVYAGGNAHRPADRHPRLTHSDAHGVLRHHRRYRYPGGGLSHHFAQRSHYSGNEIGMLGQEVDTFGLFTQTPHRYRPGYCRHRLFRAVW